MLVLRRVVDLETIGPRARSELEGREVVDSTYAARLGSIFGRVRCGEEPLGARALAGCDGGLWLRVDRRGRFHRFCGCAAPTGDVGLGDSSLAEKGDAEHRQPKDPEGQSPSPGFGSMSMDPNHGAPAYSRRSRRQVAYLRGAWRRVPRGTRGRPGAWLNGQSSSSDVLLGGPSARSAPRRPFGKGH